MRDETGMCRVWAMSLDATISEEVPPRKATGWEWQVLLMPRTCGPARSIPPAFSARDGHRPPAPYLGIAREGGQTEPTFGADGPV